LKKELGVGEEDVLRWIDKEQQIRLDPETQRRFTEVEQRADMDWLDGELSLGWPHVTAWDGCFS
jgi:hypothetical protein